MMNDHVTTPFGGGRMTARAFLQQKATAERQEELNRSEGGNDTGRADKWALISALTEARELFGLGDRTLSVIEALVSFAPGRELDGRAPLVVFPSNRALSARTRGMAPATIRRHLAALVKAGLIIRRDSPNGKRYMVKDGHGVPEEVFGFDLAPLALRATEILSAAERVRDEERRLKRLRLEISLHQRDIAKIIAAALEEGRAGDWEGHAAEFASLSQRLRRRDQADLLATRLDSLEHLHAQVENAYLSSLLDEEMSASDRHDERHHHNSNTECPIELYGRETHTGETDWAAPAREAKSSGVSLGRVLKACPDILDYAPDGIRSFADLTRTANLVRSMLGISPDAWKRAEAAMGREAAAAVIAMMLQKAETIRSPGGYLRTLTAKAENASFSLLPMLQALERARE